MAGWENVPMLRRILVVLTAVCGLTALGAAPAHADSAWGWKIYRASSTTYCGGKMVASYANNTAISINYSRSVTTSEQVSISATISGGTERIGIEIGASNEQTITINDQISMVIPPYTIVNINARLTRETWNLEYRNLIIQSYGTGVSTRPVGMCVSTAPVPGGP
ncbi:hypothetical protein [Phytohabitans aurantiacus]|uniref:Uncharacterized protein n=1 Tax=Phytohabitans aurantiacus TaxID=3016789 RepID=A0ABQ5R1Z6_9ACTN|nr:hypothetical protein [Phytohabitans aurantiacus]GLI00814.1 hypothetical protein Pa4123_60900 [Phytohabitans aurantiacus]